MRHILNSVGIDLPKAKLLERLFAHGQLRVVSRLSSKGRR